MSDSKRVFLLIGSSIVLSLMSRFIMATNGILPQFQPVNVSSTYPSYPLLLMIPAFILHGLCGNIGLIALYLIMPATFLIWCRHLFAGSERIPLRSHIAFGIISALNIIYFSFSWPHGFKYNGISFTIVVIALNLITIAVILWLASIAKKKPSFIKNWAYHFIVFSWLSLYAFPMLGELP